MRTRIHNFSDDFLPPVTPTKARRALFVAALTAVFLSFLLANDAVKAADGDFVGDVSVEHEIDFGRSVHVQLEADVNFAVAEVRAVFAPVGVRRVSSYTYPEFDVSRDGRSLTADFTIRTGGSAYVPPGTEFELFFEITGADGSVTSTSSKRILYLDPTKDWRLLSSPGIPLDFHYYGFSDSVANNLADRVSANWLDITRAIGVDSDSVDRFRAVIYPDVREMNAVFPPTSDASSDGIFFGGFAMQRFGVFVLGGPWPDSVLHELTHLIVDTKVSSPLSPGVPSWLHEGLAQFFEVGSSRSYTSQLGSAASNDRLLTLRNRNTVPARSNEIGLFYTQVGSFIGELIEMRGPEPMAETLRLINEGNTAIEAIEIAYGQPMWELENEWRNRLGASDLPAPPQPTASPPASSETPTVATVEPSSVAGSDTTDTVSDDVLANAGVVAGDTSDGLDLTGDPDDGFKWNGPLIGAIAAAIVFFIWSFRVNRRRFRSLRR